MRIAAVILAFLLLVLPNLAMSNLTVGFYNSTCHRAEAIIQQVIQKRFKAGQSNITAVLLRMHFHDCFVRGCDASILIDSTKTKQAEKSAKPNRFLWGFEIIDEAKEAVEAACPSTVSCADIIAVATRDSVALAGGPRYNIPTGRRDALVSNPLDVDIPGRPGISVSQALQAFTSKGFTLTEMVTLLGAHTVGSAHCSLFEDRLSNFNGTGSPDPSMDPALVSKLKKICGSGSDGAGPGPTAFLDQNTSFVFDNQYYNQVINKRGILQIDQQIRLDKSTAGIVSRLAADNAAFGRGFAMALVKMGNVQVLTGNAGEIRRNCRVFN